MTLHVRDLANIRAALDREAIGCELYERIQRLYPICRSITGDGVRETLRIIGQEIPIQTEEVPTGTVVYDWTVPKEWNIRDAYIKKLSGERVVDFQACNLHVLNYSVPVCERLTLDELRSHLHSIPEHPEWIPYKTSYYTETWGFCVSHRQLESLTDAEYDVCIDSSLQDGHLTIGECVLEGQETDEILFSCHVCHPSLCNDNLSGITVAVTLARLLASVSRRYTYRFLFIPTTIGAITWLARHEEIASHIRHGLVLACVGDRGRFTYKRSRRGNAAVDRAVELSLRESGQALDVVDFSPYGYDERQYCSPGFNLPVGLLSRTPHGRFPEYHTSADNLDLVNPGSLAETVTACLHVLEVLEGDVVYRSRNPKCEPRLGKHGLYASLGGGERREQEMAMLWVLNLSDGSHNLLDIAERSRMAFSVIRHAADVLIGAQLLEQVTHPARSPEALS